MEEALAPNVVIASETTRVRCEAGESRRALGMPEPIARGCLGSAALIASCRAGVMPRGEVTAGAVTFHRASSAQRRAEACRILLPRGPNRLVPIARSATGSRDRFLWVTNRRHRSTR